MFTDQFKNTHKATFGEGVYFSPNGCKGARLKENLTHVNAVFADWDFKPEEDEKGVPIEPTGAKKPDFSQFLLDIDDLPTPTYIVESGNGWHVYWCLENSIEVDDTSRDELIKQVEGIHQSIVNDYGSDNGATDVLRLLRVVGSVHAKQPDHPFKVKVVVDNDDTRYTLDELLEAIPPVYKEVVEYTPSDSELDIKQVVVDVWKEKGSTVTFSDEGHLIIDNVPTATFIGRTGDCNYVATTSTDYPAQGNATTYVAGTLGITTKEAYRWLVDKYGEKAEYKPDPLPMLGGREGDVEDIDVDDLMTMKKGDEVKVLANDENIIRILNHYKLAKYDSFTARPYVFVDGEWVIRDSGADGKVYSWLVDKFPFLANVSLNRVADVMTFVQYRNSYDSAQDYINALKWDGEARLDTWLPKVFHVEEDSYYRDIGSKWFMGLAARIMNPGCKFDNALVVHGGQKIGKSSVFLIIAGEENHIEFTDLRVREMQQDMQGKMVVEFAEAAIFSKADSESLKSIVTRQTDTYRVPYERHAKDFPRRCVFAVTANNDDILKDASGGRRWWAVEVPEDMRVYPPKRQADIHWLKDNRDQLFAEAAHRVAQGENFTDVDEYELMKRQKSITATEQDEDLFFDWYNALSANRQNEGMTGREAYVGAYKVDIRGDALDVTSVSIKKADEMRVGRIMKKIGLEKKKTNGRHIWVPGEMYNRPYNQQLPTTKHEKDIKMGDF